MQDVSKLRRERGACPIPVIGGSVVLALVWGACGGDAGPPDAPVDAAPSYSRETVAELLATPNRDVDLLFVIDDSPGMLDKQANLRRSLGNFTTALQSLPGGLPNLHVGVITSDMGRKGSGSPTPAPPVGSIGQGGCSGLGKGGALQVGAAQLVGSFLSDVANPGGGRSTNYTGSLEQVLGQMMALGAGGCGFEQPLAAMRAALSNPPTTGSFLRARAVLGVFFLSDEDDCSVKDPALFGPGNATLGPLESFRCTRFGVTCAVGGETPDAMNQVGAKRDCGANASSAYVDDIVPYREFLAGLKPNPTRVFVGGIAGNREPIAVELRPPPGGGPLQAALAHACSYTGTSGTEVADPPIRLHRFLESVPVRAPVSTICQAELSDSMQLFTRRLQQTLAGACVERALADLEPTAPDLQPDCIVEDVAGGVATPMPPCEGSPTARPCWQLERDAATCGLAPAPNLKLVVQRDAAPAPASVTRARCLVDP